jgi:flagellar hook-associated protein 2
VRIAGTTALTADNSSNLGNQIDRIDRMLSTLRLRLEAEYNRYWRQFSALETAISRMNNQSAMLFNTQAQ